MSESSGQFDLAEALANLEADGLSFAWTVRRSIAVSLRDAWNHPEQRTTVLQLATAFADDPKWEVRKEIASLLPSLSNDEFAPLAAKLMDDSNGFVRKAAQRAYDLRRKGPLVGRNRQNELDQIVAQCDMLGAIHGEAVSSQVKALSWRLFELSISGIVHDLRGILTSARSNVLWLQKEAAKLTSGAGSLREGLDKVASRLAHLEKFVEAMGTYARPVPLERTSAQLSNVIRDAHGIAIDAVTSSCGEAASVNTSITVDDNIRVIVAEHQLVTAIVNVVKNAYEAVLATDTCPDAGLVTLVAERVENNHVRIVVQDNGVGIDSEDLCQLRAFIPGHTTKKGSGTGFGLPVAQRYIAAHGGAMSLESTRNVGTIVTIILPTETQEGVNDDPEGAGH